jgi:hypothetical protein
LYWTKVVTYPRVDTTFYPMIFIQKYGILKTWRIMPR